MDFSKKWWNYPLRHLRMPAPQGEPRYLSQLNLRMRGPSQFSIGTSLYTASILMDRREPSGWHAGDSMDKRSHMPHQHKIYLRRREVSDGRFSTVVPSSKSSAKLMWHCAERRNGTFHGRTRVIIANALRDKPHPPSSTPTDGALLLVPVGTSPEGKAYLAMKLNEGAPHFWRVVLEYMYIISSCFYRVN